ncbi:MAG: hypothetical protein FJW30_22070 [Acidobacteria bacterium]|nr:hypothetical protein [Acidobacteriota bacterium]
MRISRGICFFALASLLAAGAEESVAVVRAREALDQARRLAAAGAASRRQVEQAESALAQAKDDAVIAATLDAALTVEDLTEDQTKAATEATARRLRRELDRLAGQAKLVGEGVAPRTSLLPFEDEVGRARHLASIAEQRAHSIRVIAEMIRAEEEAASESVEPAAPSIADGPIQRITHFRGENKFDTAVLKDIVLEFEKKFDRKLPISARGSTAVHRSMGFDHTGRVDVALNPDQAEGRWLMRYLESKSIPFFGFRTFVKGQATAPHIHIGPPSARIRPTD